MASHQRTRTKTCGVCSREFRGHGNSKYCTSACINRAREDRRAISCSVCGGRMWHCSRIAESPTCQPCRRSMSGYLERVERSMPQAWLCAACGSSCSRPAVRGQRPKWCDACRKALRNRDIKVSPSERVAIYVRDSWTCWLCLDEVDRSLIGSRSEWRPSLDHVEPRAHGGLDSLSNLRLAHWWCNSVRSDGRTYSPEDFRVSS